MYVPNVSRPSVRADRSRTHGLGGARVRVKWFTERRLKAMGCEYGIGIPHLSRSCPMQLLVSFIWNAQVNGPRDCIALFNLASSICSLYVLKMTVTEKPGWHTRGYHPHYESNTLVQHVVFRTLGSIPPEMMAQTNMLTPTEKSKMLDIWLDQGAAGRIFANLNCAAIMENCLRFFDQDRYDLQAWCVMPTHVHVLLVTDPDVRIGQCVHSWKQAATRKLKECLNQAGPFFAKDYFDRYCRSLKQSEATIAYIEANPVKAGLCANPSQWPWSSAFARGQGWLPRHDRLPVFLA